MPVIKARFCVAAALLGVCSTLVAGPKIGVLLKARTPFWNAMEAGAKEAGAKAGADVVVKAPLAETDVSVQIQLLNGMVAQGVDAVVIAPINRQALAVPIASIAVKGVKIVCVDTPLGGKAAPVFIGTDQTSAGQEAGKFLAASVADSDEVAIFKFAQTGGATGDREAGALATFRAAHPSTVVYGDVYTLATDRTEIDQAKLLLKEHPNVKAILASSTPGTMAMLKVLDDQKLAGKVKLVGFGFNLNPEVADAIERGALTGWVAQLPKEMGEKGVAAAVSLLKGESVPANINTPFTLVTKDNLKDPKVQALLAL